MPFHAHTAKLPDGKTTNPDSSTWESLFTSFGKGENNCQRETCQSCADLQPQHGHLNKVACHTAKFAAEMFPGNAEESKSAHQWGYLTGLWHDLGKFAPEWQIGIIRGLSILAGGWWVWPNTIGEEGVSEIFIPMDRWMARLGRRSREKHPS